MSDEWIDKNELSKLVSGFGRKKPGPVYGPKVEDIFEDIPAASPVQQPQPQPQPYPQQPGYPQPQPGYQQQPQIQQQQPVYPQVQQQPVYPQQPQPYPAQQPPVYPQQPQSAMPQVQMQPHPGPTVPHQPIPQQPAVQVQAPVQHHHQTQPATKNFDSPFIIDEDDDEDFRIEQLEQMLRDLKSEKKQSGNGSGVFDTEIEGIDEIVIPEEVAAPEVEAEDESTPISQDRIPLDIEIDPYLSLRGRLNSLHEILTEYIDLEEMMVVDQNGLSLYQTRSVENLEKGAAKFLHKIQEVFKTQKGKRNHSASQLILSDDQWLMLVPTDGKGIENKYLLKALLPAPLDRPELYVLIELLNEAMRPEQPS